VIAADLAVFVFLFSDPLRHRVATACKKNWQDKWILQAALVPNGPLNGVKNCQTLFKGYFEPVMYGPDCVLFLIWRNSHNKHRKKHTRTKNQMQAR
jgi:hypothetical protein